VRNLYSTTTNQAAIAAHFPVVNRYRGNLTPMPSLFRSPPRQFAEGDLLGAIYHQDLHAHNPDASRTLSG
jgi:hypothetical protein